MRVEEMTLSEVENILKSKSSGVLAVCLGEIPYCVPMAYGYDGESIYFIVAREGRLLSYLTTGSNVACFTVFETDLDSSNYISAILEGTVSKVSGHEIMHAASSIERQLRKPKGSLTGTARLSEENEKIGIYKLEIRNRSGRKKIEGVF